MNLHIASESWRKNLSFQLISTIYIAIFGFVISIILARKFGVDDFGKFSYILSLAGIFFIFQDGGYKTLIFRESVNDFPRALISFGVLHVVSITLFAGLVVFFLQFHLWLETLIAMSCMGLVALTGFVSSLLKGKGDFKLDAMWKIAVRSLTAIAILFLLFFFENNSITSVFAVWILALLIALIWPIKKGYLPWPSFNFNKKLLKSSMVFLTIDVATVFYFRSDIVLLEHLGSRAGDVGQYSAAYRILEGLILLATPIAVIAFRSLRLQLNNKQKFFQLLWTLLLLMICIAIFIVIIGALWGENFMVFVFGVQYLTAGSLLFWLLLAMLFIMPNYILTQGAIALNRERSYAKIVILVAIFNIICNIILIPKFGALGAAWATIFAEGILFIGLSWMLMNEWRNSRDAYWG